MQAEPAKRNPIDIFAGKRLRIIRSCAKMTEDELGKHIGRSGQDVRKFERGLKRIDVMALHWIGEVLKISPMDLFGGVDVFMRELGYAEEFAASQTDEAIKKQMLHMVSLITQMTPEKRRIAEHFLELVAKDEDEQPQGEEP